MKSIKPPNAFFQGSNAWKAKAWDYSDTYVVGNAVGESNTKGHIADIVNLFYDRYQTITDLLRNQAGFKASGTIRQITKEKKQNRQG